MKKESKSPNKFDLNSKKNSFIKINNNQNYRKINIIKEANKKGINANNNKNLTTSNINKSPLIKINHINSPKNINKDHILLQKINYNNHRNNSTRNVKLNNTIKTQPNSFAQKNKKYINIKNNINNNNSHVFIEFKNELRNNHSRILKPSTSSNNIKNDKTKSNNNKNNVLKEIPIIIKDDINKNESCIDEYPNLSDSKIITPKKRYIFNRVNPIKLLGAFKKELTSFSKKEKIMRIKNNKK